MLKRLRALVYWAWREFFRGHHPTEYYNSLAKKNIYEVAVDYKKRVNNFKKLRQFIPQPCKTMVDLGCGTGAMMEALHTGVFSIIGVDRSAGMLGIAKERFANDSKVKFIESDFISVAFPINSVDLITMGFSTRYIPPEKSLAFFSKLHSWLTPQGKFMVAVTKSYTGNFLGIEHKIVGKIPWDSYFIKIVKPWFELEAEVKMDYFLFWRHVGLVFRKK